MMSLYRDSHPDHLGRSVVRSRSFASLFYPFLVFWSSVWFLYHRTYNIQPEKVSIVTIFRCHFMVLHFRERLSRRSSNHIHTFVWFPSRVHQNCEKMGEALCDELIVENHSEVMKTEPHGRHARTKLQRRAREWMKKLVRFDGYYYARDKACVFE